MPISAWLVCASASEGIRAYPFSQAPALPATPALAAPPAATSGKPTRQKLAQRLREVVVKQQARIASMPSGSLTSLQRKSLGVLSNQLAGRLELLGLERTGVPRQIKGGVLERRVQGNGPEAETDRQTARRFLHRQRALLRLTSPATELALTRYTQDELGRRHLRYRQLHGDLPVWPAEAVVHLNPDGDVDAFEGNHVPSPSKLDLKPVVSADMAVSRAQSAVPAAAQTQAGEPLLILYSVERRQPRLAWKLELTISLGSRWLVVVDAINGAILTAYNQVADANVGGSGLDLLGIIRNLNVWQSTATSFWMVDTSKAMFDATSAPPQNARGAIRIWDARNNPPVSNPTDHPDPDLFYVTAASATSGWVADAVSAAFNLSETYDYYLERHGRNSIDGNRGNLTAIVRYGRGFQNAFWSNPYMVFGTGDRYAAALDVVGHELTHGVTEHTANLVYRGQSGALNEAFSDIFGESVEARSRGSADWLLGSDLAGPIRSMKNPALFDQPARMSEYRVMPETQDNGGVHVNSGIINHAYYLLAEGLNGGIGVRDAERIFYRALTVHLLQNSQFIDARRAALVSAEEIFGKDSVQAQRTAQAFDAVELTDNGSTPAPTPIPPVAAADSTLCVYRDPGTAQWFLCRRETLYGDPAQGLTFTSTAVQQSRPSVSGDGSLAVFVSASNDVCLINTDRPASEECLGFAGEIASVAMSPDSQTFAFVLRDATGNSSNAISLIELATESSREYTLKAPATEGQPPSIDRADDMSFTPDGRYLVYDAFNRYTVSGAAESGSWSIYALDLATDQFLMIAPPKNGVDIGYPGVGHTSNDHLVFEAKSQTSGISTVYTVASGGKVIPVAEIADDFAVPGFSGNDKAVVFAQPDATNSGKSLWLQPLADDFATPVGAASLWLSDGGFGVIYRRGTWSGNDAFSLQTNVVGAGTITSSPAGILCGNDCSESFTRNSVVTLLAAPALGQTLLRWEGCDSVAANTCTVTLNQARTATAVFTSSAAFGLQVNVIGPGTISSFPVGINCGGDCAESFPVNTLVTLSATPAPGQVLLRWEGCDSVTANTCAVKLSNARSVTAVFGPPGASLVVRHAARSRGSATVVSSPAGIFCNLIRRKNGNARVETGDCQEAFPANTTVTLSVDPKTGLMLAGSPDLCRSDGGPSCVLTMGTSDTALSLSLTPAPKRLTVSRLGEGKVTGPGIACGKKCSRRYPGTTNARLRARPATGWSFDRWEGCDAASGLACRVKVRYPRTVIARFIPR